MLYTFKINVQTFYTLTLHVEVWCCYSHTLLYYLAVPHPLKMCTKAMRDNYCHALVKIPFSFVLLREFWDLTQGCQIHLALNIFLYIGVRNFHLTLKIYTLTLIAKHVEIILWYCILNACTCIIYFSMYGCSEFHLT